MEQHVPLTDADKSQRINRTIDAYTAGANAARLTHGHDANPMALIGTYMETRRSPHPDDTEYNAMLQRVWLAGYTNAERILR